AAEEDVLRLDVAMNEPMLVGEREAVGDRERELDGAADRQAAGAHDQLLQVLAVDVLEDDVLAPLVLAAVDDGDDVRVGGPPDRARLAPEALDVLGVVDVALVEDLDRDAAVELDVAGAEDARHAAAAAELLELVAVGDHVAGLRGPGYGAHGRPGSRHTATTG